MENAKPDLRRQFTADSAGATFELGRIFGGLIETPCVLALYGDLGAGKTLFAQGLARGLGVPADIPVTSPTYTLINRYDGRLPLYHVDLYRIQTPEELEETELDEILRGSTGVVAIEWADRLNPGELPQHFRLDICIQPDDARSIAVFAYGRKRAHLLQEVDQKYGAAVNGLRSAPHQRINPKKRTR